MKQIFTLFAAMLLVNVVSAQNNSGAISACNDPEGGIQISYDATSACVPDGKTDLTGLTEIGFHSGGTADVNEGWGTGIDWDAGTATTGEQVATDSFRVYISDVDAYYGVTGIARINFVFNQGPVDSANPWNAEGKDNNEAGDGCQDFYIILADVTEACATTASIRNQVIDLGFTVAPNPMDAATTIRFNNASAQSFDVKVMGLDGRVVREYNDVRGEELTIERGQMPAGLYFVNFVNEAGKRASTSLMVK